MDSKERSNIKVCRDSLLEKYIKIFRFFFIFFFLNVIPEINGDMNFVGRTVFETDKIVFLSKNVLLKSTKTFKGLSH